MKGLVRAVCIIALAATAWVLFAAFLIMVFGGIVQVATPLSH